MDRLKRIDYVKLAYAITLVIPIIVKAVEHLYGFVKDTVNEVVTKFKEALG